MRNNQLFNQYFSLAFHLPYSVSLLFQFESELKETLTFSNTLKEQSELEYLGTYPFYVY